MINEIIVNSGASFLRVLLGGSVAVLVGVLLGFFRYMLPLKLKNNVIVNLFFDLPKFPPPIAWIPFVILFSGIGNRSAIIIVIIGVVPSIFNQTYDGLQSIKREILVTAQSMELSILQKVFHIMIPAILPQLMTGIRNGFSMGWMSIIAAEMISGQSGLGYSIQVNRINLQYDRMIYDMLAIGVIGFLLTKFLYWLESRLVKWKN